MIHYLVPQETWWAMEVFRRVEPTLAPRLVVLPYERAFEEEALTPGVYIFSDLDRLSDAELRAATELWRRLTELGPKVRLLNDPARVLGRYELLRMLHASGINRFNVFRIPNPLPSYSPKPMRFPVFLREEVEHTGRLTDRLRNWKDVLSAVRSLCGSGPYSPEDLLIVEWCDTSDSAGVFRKCSAFVIGETIIARELFCSREWLVKNFMLVDPEYLREARAFVAENPHASFLRDIARRANIDYGRIDYGLLDGQPQIWEINLNPMIISHPKEQDRPDLDRLSLELHRVPMRRIATALEALDRPRQRQTTDSSSGPSTAATSA
jgi:hypothetical protein